MLASAGYTVGGGEGILMSQTERLLILISLHTLCTPKSHSLSIRIAIRNCLHSGR
jgi:hypothetical protein